MPHSTQACSDVIAGCGARWFWLLAENRATESGSFRLIHREHRQRVSPRSTCPTLPTYLLTYLPYATVGSDSRRRGGTSHARHVERRQEAAPLLQRDDDSTTSRSPSRPPRRWCSSRQIPVNVRRSTMGFTPLLRPVLSACQCHARVTVS